MSTFDWGTVGQGDLILATYGAMGDYEIVVDRTHDGTDEDLLTSVLWRVRGCGETWENKKAAWVRNDLTNVRKVENFVGVIRDEPCVDVEGIAVSRDRASCSSLCDDELGHVVGCKVDDPAPTS